MQLRILCGLAIVLALASRAGAQCEPRLNASDPEEEGGFGVSVSLSGDTAVVGAYRTDGVGVESGAAYVYVRAGGGWTQQQKLTASDAVAFDHFGRSVFVDGDTAVVGAYANDSAGPTSGSVYVFVRFDGVWTQQQKLTASDTAAFDHFGHAVSVSGDTVVVGAYGNDDADPDSGSAYVFVRSGGVWNQQQKLTAPLPAPFDYFGFSVSVDGDTAVVGAPNNDGEDENSGLAYVFVRSGSVWTVTPILLFPDHGGPFEVYSFGVSVSLSEDTVIVGASGSDAQGIDSGAAFTFVRSGEEWTQQQTLTASDAASSDSFGGFVSLSGDTAVVGANNNDGADINSGSAYVFVRSGGVWIQQPKLVAWDAGRDDNFGRSVSVSGDAVLVGAYRHDHVAFNSGSVYVFQGLTPCSATVGDDKCEGGMNANMACAQHSDCPGSSCQLKNRFLAAVIPATATSHGIKVTLVNIDANSAATPANYNGTDRWAAAPALGVVDGMSPSFNAANVQCTFVSQDWSAVGLLHLYGDVIVPGSTYDVSVCSVDGGPCSTPLRIDTAKFGDVITPVNNTNFQDVGNILAKFQGTPAGSSKTRTKLTKSTLVPTDPINFQEVSACVSAFQSKPFKLVVPTPPAICP